MSHMTKPSPSLGTTSHPAISPAPKMNVSTTAPPQRQACMSAKSPSQTSAHHTDGETESDEDLDEPTEPAERSSPPGLIVLLDTGMGRTAEDHPASQEEEEPSQNGISRFASPNRTPQKVNRKSRKNASILSRDTSTASTIPDSVQGDMDNGTPRVEASISASDSTPALIFKKKRKFTASEELSHDGADTRLFKAAKYEESSLDEIVISKPNISKWKTPSRPSTQRISTQKTRGTQRASRTPVTPVLKLSSTSSSVKIPNKVLFSSSKLSAGEKGWLKKQTAIVEQVPGRRAKFVCVVRDKDLPATVKVLRSLIANKLVVSDQWVIDSKISSELLDPSDYLHTDLRGSNITQNDRRNIWKGKTLFFTTCAARGYGADWESVKLIASDAGAAVVVWGNANKGGELLYDKANTILFGTDITKDLDAQALLSEYRRTVYYTKMFSTAIIEAEFDLSSDYFRLVFPSEDSTMAKRDRGRR